MPVIEIRRHCATKKGEGVVRSLMVVSIRLIAQSGAGDRLRVAGYEASILKLATILRDDPR
jgi:hypothetical protein